MLKHLMNDTAQLKHIPITNEYDLTVFQQIKTFKCKFEFASSVVESGNAVFKTKPARMFCSEPDISVGDIVSYNSENYKVIQVNKYDDLDGVSMFYEVFLV